MTPRARRALRIAWPIVAAATIALLLWALTGKRAVLSFSLAGRELELLRPRALLLAALAPLVLGLLPLSLVDLPRAQQRVTAALRALFVVALALALSRPSVVDARKTVATVLLVDVSDSISDAQLAEAHQLVESARAARQGDNLLRLVTFGRHPLLVDLPPDGTALPPLARHDRDGSDLDEALQLAYTLYPPGTIQRALLVTDGNETEGNLEAQALAARGRPHGGVHVDWTSFPAAQDDEVLVRGVTLPADVKVGAPFDVSARVYASRPQKVVLTLYRDEFINPREGKKEIALTAGENLVRWKSEVAQPGFTTFTVRLAAPAGATLRDRFPANNQAVAALAVKGKPRVLYVEGEPAAASYLSNALKKENIDVEVRGPQGLPASPRDLARYDLVLLSDVPSMYVGPQQMAALESYVRDLGGGFIMAGGENSFGSGGWTGSKMEQLLPVRFDVERKRDQPSLALVLTIDRSGSMQAENKLELAKEAAKATAELLGPDDLIGVDVFDQVAQPVVRLQRAANRTRIQSQIASIQAGGGTNILPALRMAYEELDPVAAKVKHVILLTDGQASYDGIAQLVDEMVEHKITVSAVGVGGEADKTLLTMIAERGGGRFYHTLEASNVPKIFTKETSQVARSALVEEAIGVQVVKRVELLDGTGIENAPPLRGYVAVKPKPMSEEILGTSRGEPLLQRWRVGLGQAVAFTSDVKNRWAVDWLRWPGYGKFWAHLVRSTMRHTPGQSSGGTGASFDLSVDVDPPHAHIAVDATAGDDTFLSGLDSTLQVIDPAHPQKRLEIPLAEIAAGRYEGDFTLDRYGAYLLRAIHRQNGTEIAESAGTLSLPYPREYLALPPDDSLLQRAASLTGGHARPTPAQLFDDAGEHVTFHRELWPFILWLCAALLLLDVASRRVRLLPG